MWRLAKLLSSRRRAWDDRRMHLGLHALGIGAGADRAALADRWMPVATG